MIVLNIVFLLIELAMLTYIILNIRRSKQISIKDMVIYPFLLVISAIVVFVAQLRYESGRAVWEIVPSAFTQALEFIQLKISSELTQLLVKNDIFLLINYLLLYLSSILALLSLSLSLMKTFIRNAARIKWFEPELCYVVGFNDDVKTYIKSLTREQRKKTCVVLVQAPGQKYTDEKIFLDDNKIKFYSLPFDSEAAYHKSLGKLTSNKKKQYTVIYFLESDKAVADSVNFSKSYMEKNGLFGKNLQFIVMTAGNQTAFVKQLIKGDPHGLFIETEDGKKIALQDESRGCIRAFDKYEVCAYEFVRKHNFAKYFPASLKNANGTVADCDINLFVLGLGKMNKALLNDILIETQFVTVKDKRLTPLRLNVHAYDDNDRLKSLALSSGFFKYKKSEFVQKHYLELPDDYSSHIKLSCGVSTDAPGFINSIYDELKDKAEKKPQINYFLISLDSEFSNYTFAESLKDGLSQLKNVHNVFFVRNKDDLGLPAKENMYFYGSSASLLTYDYVVADATYRMAKAEHALYSGGELTDDAIRKGWSRLSQIKQRSNLYSVASIPFKLALLGFDGTDITDAEYYAVYDKDNERGHYVYSDRLASAKGSFSARDVMAFIEHERWNAFELSVGALPMKKSKALTFENPDGTGKASFRNKSSNELYHLCLTTARGLNEYYDFVSDINKKYGLDETADVIVYDYSLMDNLPTHLKYLK